MISPVACTIENIYVIKSWFRPCVATLQPHHCNPHGFRFQRNEHGEAEMSYRSWAKSARKKWLPMEGSIIILRQIPPSKPAKYSKRNQRFRGKTPYKDDNGSNRMVGRHGGQRGRKKRTALRGVPLCRGLRQSLRII